MRRGFAGLPPGLFQKLHPSRVGNSSPASWRSSLLSEIRLGGAEMQKENEQVLLQRNCSAFAANPRLRLAQTKKTSRNVGDRHRKLNRRTVAHQGNKISPRSLCQIVIGLQSVALAGNCLKAKI